MKILLFLLIAFPVTVSAQLRIAVANGNFSSPSTWNCTCIPTDGDSVEINKVITMDMDLHFSSKEFRIKSSGKLLQDATPRSFWVDGTCFLYNSGTIDVKWMHVSTTAEVDNNSKIIGLDSLWNQGYISSNSLIETINMTNDEGAILDNNSKISVFNDFHNQGYFEHSGNMSVYHEYFNCNNQTTNATTHSSGTICVYGDFVNCSDDSIHGPGVFNFAAGTYNYGSISGSGVYHTDNGTFTVLGDFNGPVLSAGVCATADVMEYENLNFSVYPNPVSDVMKIINENNLSITSVKIYNSIGKMVLNESGNKTELRVTKLPSGIYFLRIESGNSYWTTKFIIKK